MRVRSGGEDNKPRILYLMNVDWAWIAQRPHFLAIELGKHYDVTVVYLKHYIKRWKSQTSVVQTNKSRNGLYLPLQDKIPVFQAISDASFIRAMGNLDDFDIIWIGSPLYFHFIKDFKCKIIYDCMDNNAEFADSEERRQEIIVMEDALIKRADHVICSSSYLCDAIEKRGGAGKISLVRNGFISKGIHEVSTPANNSVHKLGYIGTVSSWMDFEALKLALEAHDDIEIHMIGPAPEQTGKSLHERLIFDGTVEHDKLFDYIKDYDCLIMPFVINDVIEAVDPIKLYEYISFGKCILSVYYKEIERFSDLVHFYQDSADFVTKVGELKTAGFPVQFSDEQQKAFLGDNSWEIRGDLVGEIIEKL
ncbi:MAG: hypothetical protein HUJ70_13810 [Pseudobutyrivibrio sp.]|nr:hypothetical protein [Pseudobutyrivibrio sp.]